MRGELLSGRQQVPAGHLRQLNAAVILVERLAQRLDGLGDILRLGARRLGEKRER